ncbi:MAG: motility protein A [Phycisphaerae bacterium]|nr:motility protein A [Phycisphaerae bacterium]
MDIATIIGIVLGLACILIAVIADGGQFGLFFNIPAIVVVIGGSIAAVFVHFSMKEVFGIAGILKKTVFNRLPSEQELIQKMVDYSAINRRDGALALEQQLASAGEPFLVKSLQMVIDGQSEQAIQQQLASEILYLEERHSDGKKIMDFIGASCPALGMVGTLIGLVQMFSHMDDPQSIGAGMAAALVCTFYGAWFANLFFLPMGGKLGMRSKKEKLIREMILEGVIGIVRGESPTTVRERMQAFISARHREQLKPRV